MKTTEFHEKLKDSGIKPGTVLKAIFNHERFQQKENRDKYPEAFDVNGKPTLNFESNQKLYHTYCPFHTGQTNGDSFAVYNNDQTVYCYSGGCTSKPLNMVELVISLVFDQSPDVAINRDLSGPYFWPAVKFLVQHFGNELGIKLGDLKSEGGFKRDVTQEILQKTVEYYHFLGTKTNYAKKLDEYYLNTRHFKYAEIPFKTIKEDYLIGITPRSEEGDKLLQYLIKKGFKEKEIIDSRVCYRKDDGKIIDSFRNHAIVPYFHNKKVFGFYGKNLDPNARIPHKRLAGLYDTPSGLDDISGYDEFFLVEGENSKKALQSMGIKNVMEMRGAKGFKDIHAEKIKKLRDISSGKLKKVYLVLDPDPAGQDEVMKTGKQLLEIAGVEPLVVSMPILEKDNEPWHLDTNDLYAAYQGKAKEVFLSLKDQAKSLDAFSIIYLLKKENISTLSEARVALKRHSSYLDTVPKLERIFILEEVIEQLYPSFEKVGLGKELLRDYLKELWLNQEVKKPIEGLEQAEKKKHPYWIGTKNEETYKKYKERVPQLLLVRNLINLEKLIAGKNILFDSSFNENEIRQFNNFNNLVYTCDLGEDESGKVVLENLKKL